MITLPEVPHAEAFRQWRSAPDLWIPVVKQIAGRAGVDATRLTRFTTGTNLVVDLNGVAVLKLFPPLYAAQFTSERAALQLLDGQLSVPIPRIMAQGHENGWSWLIMTRLDGTVGSEVWPVLSEDERVHIIGQIGQTIAQVQAVSPGALAAVKPGWSEFIARQRAGCLARHQQQGLPAHFVADLEEVLRDAPLGLQGGGDPVILTGEWIPENLLLSQTPDGWRLGAVIDFGDVMTGPGAYDLLGPSTFMCAGVPDRLRALLVGYGVTARTYDAAMRRRLLTLMLLHRASDLRKIAIPGWEDMIDHLQGLQGLVWPEVFQDDAPPAESRANQTERHGM